VQHSDRVNVSVTHLADQLVASYARVGGINHLDGKNLPSKTAIAQITVDLLRLLFPGFFDERIIHSSEIKTETAVLMDSVVERLESEVAKSLEYAPPSNTKKAQLRALARHLTGDFLASLPAIRDLLQTDVEAAFNGDPAALSKEEVIVAYPFVEAIAVQRLAHQLYLKQVALIPRIMTEWAHTRSGMDLHPGARIGSHFFVDHCTGTVVGETTIIGEGVKMYQGVGLVARSLSGGNQQKLILGREFGLPPSLLLVSQPTRGVDIGAIEFIHRKIIAMRDAGCAVLLVSAELEEVMSLSDRLLIIHKGRIAGEVDPTTATPEQIGLLMTGGQHS